MGNSSTTDAPHPYNKIGDGPEGPEVRITTEWLHHNFSNKILTGLDWTDKSSLIRNGSYKLPCKINNEKQNKTIKDLLPLKLDGVTCKGKHIVLMFSSYDNKKVYMHCHLRMTGRWTIEKTQYTKITFTFSTDQDNKFLYFDCKRRLGEIYICYSLVDLNRRLRTAGKDLMDSAIKYHTEVDNDKRLEQFNVDRLVWIKWFLKIKANKQSNKRPIYTSLMDQRVFSGIGNYLAAEILYESQIRPDRKLKDLSQTDMYQIFTNIYKIMWKSYNYGGLTIQDFWDPQGRMGKYPRKVYGKDKDPHGNKVKKTKFNNGRTCHWVPELQK